MLFRSRFDPETKRRSFLYYEPRTLHKSSLSPAIHAAVAAELGKDELAYRYFRTAVYADLTDTYGNTKDGVHAATMGGAWQAAVCGFAGVRAQKGMLTLNPHLPPGWKRLSFSIQWRELPLDVSIDKETVQLRLRSADTRKTLPLRVYGKPEKLVPNRTTTFTRKPRERPHIELDGMY